MVTKEKPEEKGVNLFEYIDFRRYLCDYYHHQKKHTSYFSYRYFSQKAGFSSHNVLKFIMHGQRNMAINSVPKFARALELNEEETHYFQLLVMFSQAKTEKEKHRLFRKIMEIKHVAPGKRVNELQYRMYNEWYHSAIRELITLKGFKDDYVWIAKLLSPAIKPKQVKQSFQLLEELGLIERNKKGTWVQKDPIIKTDAEVNKISVRNHTRNMIHLGERSIGEFSPEIREISGMTLGISPKAAEEIKKRIQKFKDELLNYVASDTSDSQEVYQLNYQFFPLLKKK